MIGRREVLLSSGAAALVGIAARHFRAVAQPVAGGRTVSIAQFGARADASADNTAAIQAAIDSVQHSGGGTVLISGRYRCGKIVISGSNVRLQGKGGWLVDGRLTIKPGASNIEVVDLGMIETSGEGAFLVDVSGRNCRFRNLELVKDPIAGGYQMYVRQSAAQCRFDGLKIRGSKGIFLAGVGHSFENFDLTSKAIETGSGGDDAFAIKAVDAPSGDITIRNGVVRGFSAIVSFGSEIGTRGASGRNPGVVRNVTVENVTGDRCNRVAYFKPGALSTDWRGGVVEGIRLRNLTLQDPSGKQFRAGIQMLAGRGAVIRDVQATGISIVARARDSGIVHTAAVSILIREKGAPATIENVALQVKFVDPYNGAPHSKQVPGYPVERVASITRHKGGRGKLADITLDVEGRGTGIGGILVGSDLDGAVAVRRAVLDHIGASARPNAGHAVIVSESRVALGEVHFGSSKLPRYGGKAFGKERE